MSHIFVLIQEEEALRRAVWEKNMKMIKLHNGENGLGKNGYTMEMNAFGDMVSVTWITSPCVLLSALHGVFSFLTIYVLSLEDRRRIQEHVD